MNYEIVSIDKLVPLEKVFPIHLKNLEQMIETDGYVLKAIIVDKKRGIILDGSHRYIYFLKKGYRTVPVYYVDYNDENIRVGTRLKHRFSTNGDLNIGKVECIKRAESGNLFPPRTTRHFFTFRKADISIPLSQLNKGKPRDVSHLIDDVEKAEEITHNKQYIKEIDEETEIIINYLSEVAETKKYLLNQITLMERSMEIAFFPGKFHPPHLGHIKTIQRLLPKYRKLIIGVSGHIPGNKITTPKEIYIMLTSFFKNNDNVKVVFMNEFLIEKKNTDNLPEFDVMLSGNQDVLDWAKKFGIKAEFIPRSDGVFCSGTELRKILKGSI